MLGVWVFITFTFITSLFIYYLWGRDQNPKAPPGPTPWPIVGNLFHIARASSNVTLAFSELSKIYGEIFTVRMGFKPCVILTSKDAIETILSNELTFARDVSGAFEGRCLGKNIGIVFSDGEVWEKTRAWTIKNLKEYGFGKTLEMEHYILNATEDLFKEIDKQMKNYQMINVEMIHSLPILSIIWELMVQRLSDEDREEIKLISEKSEKWIRSSFMWAGILNSFPIVSSLIPKSMTGFDIQLKFFETSKKVTKKMYLNTQALLKKENRIQEDPHSFVEAFVQKSFTEPSAFYLEHFQILFEDILLASGETTSSFMEYVILFLILHPDMQEKIHEEIVKVSPAGGFLSYADRKKMVYTQAFILETHRNGRILQNFVPRKTLGDISFKDYVIKKGTIIIPDTHLYYANEKRWKDAQTFRPERFINDKEELCNASDIISFSFGKRSCPGELYTNVVIFFFLTGIVQRYKISVPPGHPTPITDLRPGIVFKPFPFKACYTKRDI